MKAIILPVIIFACAVDSARILAVFTYPSYSHQIIFKEITKELAKRGHELYVFTTLPDGNNGLKNYKEITLETRINDNVDLYAASRAGVWNLMYVVLRAGSVFAHMTLSHPKMQELLSPNNTIKFDLVMVQSLYQDSLFGLAHHFNAPLIGVSSLQILRIQEYQLGAPLQLAYSPDIFLGYSDTMNLWERLANVLYAIQHVYHHETKFAPLHNKIARQYFGDSVPTVQELTQKMSLFLTNSHPFFTLPHAQLPSIIPMGRCRKLSTNTTLPPDLKKIMDESRQGVIYFSLGSNLHVSQLPDEVRKALLEAFTELPYTILWKSDAEYSNLPRNVISRKWMPQQGILAHPNTVLFLYQGGLQSTEEVTSLGLPVVGFPIYSDQFANVKRLQTLGVAECLDLDTIDKETLKNTILKVITNPSYKNNAIKLRDLLNDFPYDIMNNTIWWIEHVIRHKGAAHLYNKSRELPLYQSLLLDVIAIMITALIVVLYLTFIVTRFLFKRGKYFIKVFNSNVAPAKKKQ